MIIDCHGHYTTAPKALQDYRDAQIAALKDPAQPPYDGKINISDDQIRESLEGAQLKLQRERGTDVTIFSPRASAMAHHIGTATTSSDWSRHCNDLIHRVCTLYPSNFVGVCQLPQSPGVPPANVIEELERCVNEFGFVGCNLNPDPSGGYWTGPPLGDEWWYPLYERLEALEVPAMIHASATCNPAFHTTGSHYLNVDATAFLQLMESRVFQDFPTLKLVISHGGGNVPYQAARYRALCLMNKWEPFEAFVKRLYFDTTVYNQDAMQLLLKIVGPDNVMFASEMLGGVTTIDPQTGRFFDDNKPCLDAVPWLTEADRAKLFEHNVVKAYPRLAPILARRALTRSDQRT